MAGDTLKPAGVGILLSPAVDRDHGRRIDEMAAQSPASTFFAIADAAPSLRWLRVVEAFLARLGPWLRKHKARASSFQTTCRP